jgi:hypothetical protein
MPAATGCPSNQEAHNTNKINKRSIYVTMYMYIHEVCDVCMYLSYSLHEVFSSFFSGIVVYFHRGRGSTLNNKDKIDPSGVEMKDTVNRFFSELAKDKNP